MQPSTNTAPANVAALSDGTNRKLHDITNTNRSEMPGKLGKSQASSAPRTTAPCKVVPEIPTTSTIMYGDLCPENVNDYAQDICLNLREKELAAMVSPTYMHRQTEINEKMRAHLIDWLVSAILSQKLTLFHIIANIFIHNSIFNTEGAATPQFQLRPRNLVLDNQPCRPLP